MLINPHPEVTEDDLAAIEAFTKSNDEPIVMVNPMQVRPHAEYENPALNDFPGRCRLGSSCCQALAVGMALG